MLELLRQRTGLVAVVSAIVAVTLAAVVWALTSGSDDGTGSGGGSSASGSSGGSGPAGSGASPGGTGPSSTSPALPAGAVGAGCPDYAAAVPSGPGSMAAMSGEPATTVIAGSPLLHTFAAALSGGLNPRVDLTAELRGPVTVFAPVDSAFALVAADRMARLRHNATALRRLLRAHIVPGRLAADAVVGAHRTRAGTTVRVAGPGEALTVDGIPVVCGGLRTAEATLYLVGAVLPDR